MSHSCFLKSYLIIIFSSQQPINKSVMMQCERIELVGRFTAQTVVQHHCSSAQSDVLSTICTCFFCLSLIRTYMVQVQKQAQEQELFLLVKWVWVRCVSGQPGASKKKKNGRVCASWHLTAVTGLSCLFFPFFSLPSCSCTAVLPLIISDCWWPESLKDICYWNPAKILYLDSMVFAATGCF